MYMPEKPRRHESSRTFQRGRKSPSETGQGIFLARLLSCLAILLTVFLIKVFFPDFSRDFSEKILQIVTGDVDYKGAFVSIGEAFSGEKGVVEAFSDAGNAILKWKM